MSTNRFDKRGEFKILVVEDNLLDYELMELRLSSEFPCQIAHAMTKVEFEAALAQNRPDLIVSDSNVIAFDGFTALRIATEKCPEVPFVFCSGSSPDRRLEAVPRPDVGWVSKDNAFAGLVAFVKKTLEARDRG